MAPHIHNRERPLQSTLLSILLIFVGIIACCLSLFVGVDWACHRDINTWMPIYPNSELVAQEYNFVRPRAMGITSATYTTSDATDVVRRWYTTYRRELTSGLAASGETVARGLAATRYQVVENLEGDGTLVIQYSECAYD